jgi:hypothetical protein
VPFIALVVPLKVKGEVALHLREVRGRVSFNVIAYELPGAKAKDPTASGQQYQDGEDSDEDEQKHRDPGKTPWTFLVQCNAAEE